MHNNNKKEEYDLLVTRLIKYLNGGYRRWSA